MFKKAVPILLAGLCAAGATHAHHSAAHSVEQSAAKGASGKTWITLGDAAYRQLQKLAPQVISQASRAKVAGANEAATTHQERVHLVQVDEQQMLNLSHAVHHELRRCGGFMFHESEAAGLAALDKVADPGLATGLLAPSRPSYVINNQDIVTPMLPQMQDSNIAQTIVDLSSFTNRYYTTTSGVSASNWLAQRWQQMAAGRSDITVQQFTHSWAQKSVILTIQGTDNASEVVVLGGHLDSIHRSGTSESTRAPGADDDASGIASMTEVIRVMIANNYKPRRTIKFIGYAAEEVGLRGSQAIASNFKANNVNVVGVMQLDMTNYQGSANDIYIFTDYTDSAQNQFVANLLSTYLPTLKVGYDRCGYACSDHASWHQQGFFASMPFESSMSQSNPNIHTSTDTYANMGNQALHALKFARMALAYAVELGSDGAAPPPPPDKVETFSGTLARTQKVTYGPFKVAAGGSLTASTTGSGDADLYVRRNSVPTTTSYDCRSIGSTSTENCTVSMTANGDVYVMVYGYTASSYNLTVTYRPQQ
ncbi:MAG TPA: M28 family metallopeptidase [Paucimonas sp.]|nr:M28 family metallopeptidase [Paucimonas sp.]